VSKAPTKASDIPIEDLMTFIISLLEAVATLFSAKEAVEE